MIEYYKFFSKKKYAEDFLRGNLYMNSMAYFWANGFEGQADFGEGSLRSATPAQMLFPDDLAAVVKGPVVSRITAYRYCNICCFSRLVVDHKRRYAVRFDPRIRDFGPYTVRILDMEAFQHRVAETLAAQGSLGIGGAVSYLPPDPKLPRDCLCKDKAFNWQFEWRIACIPNMNAAKQDAAIYRTPQTKYHGTEYILRVGDLSKICRLYPSDMLWNEGFFDMYPGYTVYDSIRDKGMLDEDETKELLREIDYAFGVGVHGRDEFQQKVLSLTGDIHTMFYL